MKFEVINNETGSIDYRGYVFAAKSDRFIDNELFKQLKIERGEMFVENQKDAFYDGCFNPICRGDDEKLYAVQFVNVGNQEVPYKEVPFIWQEVEPMTVDNCTIEKARTFARLTQAQMSEKIGIPIRTISNWETGSRTPNDWTAHLVKSELLKIAHENQSSRIN